MRPWPSKAIEAISMPSWSAGASTSMRGLAATAPLGLMPTDQICCWTE
jgi:hypothetical protein